MKNYQINENLLKNLLFTAVQFKRLIKDRQIPSAMSVKTLATTVKQTTQLLETPSPLKKQEYYVNRDNLIRDRFKEIYGKQKGAVSTIAKEFGLERSYIYTICRDLLKKSPSKAKRNNKIKKRYKQLYRKPGAIKIIAKEFNLSVPSIYTICGSKLRQKLNRGKKSI